MSKSIHAVYLAACNHEDVYDKLCHAPGTTALVKFLKGSAECLYHSNCHLRPITEIILTPKAEGKIQSSLTVLRVSRVPHEICHLQIPLEN